LVACPLPDRAYSGGSELVAWPLPDCVFLWWLAFLSECSSYFL